jgi:hypothetical protein
MMCGQGQEMMKRNMWQKDRRGAPLSKDALVFQKKEKEIRVMATCNICGTILDEGTSSCMDTGCPNYNHDQRFFRPVCF